MMTHRYHGAVATNTLEFVLLCMLNDNTFACQMVSARYLGHGLTIRSFCCSEMQRNYCEEGSALAYLATRTPFIHLSLQQPPLSSSVLIVS